ncbi:nuclear factor 1 C-type isoform X6 [Crotalus tigris]|uniref:nuclear factor 1 C-type isoform X6 n=1 Tax=Crotalus tigris TaxID=88082 RepID=UPI00192F90D4|nr:nuclear factor 1 C-type isoform X6 [Crotalus tigris]
MSVAGTTPVCLSTTPIDTGNHTQVDPGRCRSSLDCSTLATASVVCRPCGSLNITPVEDLPRPSNPQSGQTLTSRPSVAATSRLALERQSLAMQSYSSGVISIIQESRRPSTKRIYYATWKAFCRWCSLHHLDPLLVTIPNILDYLLEGLNKGLSVNTIRRQVVALSTVLSCDNSTSLSQHPAISAFLKGAVNTKPPVIHRYPSWNLSKVLQALTSAPFEPLDSYSLHHLSLKVAFLIVITSARRISELAALSVRKDLCTFFKDKVVLRPDPAFMPKVNSIFHRSQELILPDFCPNPKHRLEHRWHKLDVRRALCYYVKCTSSFRKSEALFVSFQPSTMGKKVSSSTIGRWIRACIAQAYVSQASPVPPHVIAHSTRSVPHRQRGPHKPRWKRFVRPQLGLLTPYSLSITA